MWKLDTDALNTNGDISLVVAVRRAKNFVGYRVEFLDRVETDIRTACEQTVDLLARRGAVEYSADVDLGSSNTTQYLAIPEESLRVSSEDDNGDRIEIDHQALKVLDAPGELETLSAQSLHSITPVFYAACLDNGDQQVAFVKKANPVVIAQRGLFLTAQGARLTSVRQPVFVMSTSFDMVLGPGGMAVLNQTAFETLFRDVELMTAKYPSWIQSIASKLPLIGGAEMELAALCAQNSRLARRLRVLHESGLMKHATMPKFQQYVRSQGENQTSFVKGGKLLVSRATAERLLQFLNEDLWTGVMSNTRYASGSKVKVK